MKTSEHILNTLAEIEAALLEQQVPGANPELLRRIRFLAGYLDGWSDYAAEKGFEIVELSTIFYSERKHWDYPGGYQALWDKMTIDLPRRIRREAIKRANAGD